MQKKRRKKYKRKRFKRNRRSLGASRYGPLIITILIIVGIVAAVILGYRYAFPAVMNQIGVEWPPPTSPPPTPAPTPTPTPKPIEVLDATTLQEEMIPSHDVNYIADPFRYGDEIVFSGGGLREEGGPAYDQLYFYNIESGQTEPMNTIPRENDNFFLPRMNDKWLIVLDQKETGGGFLRVMNRQSKEQFVAKEYYDGMPNVTLSEDRICWMERTGSQMDKLFLFDLVTRESVALDMFSNSSFGQSDPHMSEDEIVWATFDVNRGAEATSTDEIGAITYIRFDDPDKELQSYSTGMFVHDPKSKGDVRVWTDQNGGPSPTLYISIAEKEPQMVDTEVTDYALGDNFLAYVKQEAIYLYFWDYDIEPKMLSREGERCILSSVNDNTVVWFNTGVSDRVDVVKYAEVSIETD